MLSNGANPKSIIISNGFFRFGDFVLDSESRHLTQNGNIIKLTSKSFELLQLLLQEHGKIVTREEILHKVWQEEFVEDSNVNVQIAILRKILGNQKEFIQTISKRGYCFTAKVEEDSHSNNGFAPLNVQTGHETTSLAVLPLVNLDGNEELDYFADGLTESLINLLSKMPELKVMAYRTVARFKNRDIDIADIGKTLNVGSILTGRVRQFRDEVTISTELIKVKDDSQIWGTSYQKAYSDIFQIQEEITQTIAEKLLPNLKRRGKNVLTNQQTLNAEAYDDYLRGCHFLSTHTKEGLEKSLEYFYKAITLDEHYALAYVGIANAYFLLNGYSFSPVNDILAETNQAIKKALQIAPDFAEVRATLGTIKYVYEWDWQEAESEFLLAIKFNPNYTFARYWYVVFLMLSGRFSEAHDQLDHLVKIDPLSLSLNKTLASLLYYEKRYEESILQAEKTLELYPNCIPVYPAMAISFAKLGEHQKALDLMQKGYESAPSLSRLAVLGYLFALAGNKRKALEIIEKIDNESAAPLVENFYIHIGLGEIEKGFAHLNKSLVQKDLEHVALIVEPRADTVRNHPRFIEILSKIH
ncbi:winged helix-turn-helix domain-containing tetratricopeptide repeat protein [soil metagenome]